MADPTLDEKALAHAAYVFKARLDAGLDVRSAFSGGVRAYLTASAPAGTPEGKLSAWCANCGKPPLLSLSPVNDVMNLSVVPTCACSPEHRIRGFNIWWNAAPAGTREGRTSVAPPPTEKDITNLEHWYKWAVEREGSTRVDPDSMFRILGAIDPALSLRVAPPAVEARENKADPSWNVDRELERAADSARLDALEAMAREREGIHLHDGSHLGCLGLGLRRRTLRAAIDAALHADAERGHRERAE